MPEFLHLISPSDALEKILDALPQSWAAGIELVSTREAHGRILAERVSAPHPLPPFPRSTVDGYAVQARDTFGASGALPAYLRLIGEILMGKTPTLEVGPGEAAQMHTGGTIPSGADAVVMLEDTQLIDDSEIEVHHATGVGQNILLEGEDVQQGDVVLEPGTLLRPQEIGGLMALGMTSVSVAVSPRVGILSSGDEVVPPEMEPGPAQVRDINSHTLSALINRLGGNPILRGIVPDQHDVLFEAVKQSHLEDDLIIITAGSSVSARDITGDIIQSLGKPGVLVHGISIKPGKPTILAVADDIPLIGLPGNPVSALVVGALILAPLIRRFLGVRRVLPIPQVPAKLSVNVVSQAGREDFLPVRLQKSEEGTIAEPVFGRSNLIFTLVRADGLVHIPSNATGLSAGAEVMVTLFSSEL
ncbi:MAG: molybdopterin molybdotransferase MoeA [Anaerolineales bacterium]|jgi:molybdopterin molybdotransferase|nr:molybdopterin molybdotransferase MoeA [Anaerolineales bacterium]